MPRSGNSNSQNNYNESAIENDNVINYQNILLDNLGEPVNITFITPSPLNSLVSKRKTNFTANEPHIKKYDQTALDCLKLRILTEVTQEVKKCNRITSVIEIVIVSELQEKNVLVKSLVTSHMLHENVHVPYKNVEMNPRISPKL